MLKAIKRAAKRLHEHKVTGWPYFFIMTFLIIFMMQLIMLIILLKQ
jgi:hypothetical protein